MRYCTIDGNTIAEVAISQNVSSIRHCDSPAITARFSVILLLNVGDSTHDFNKTSKHV